MPLKEDTNTRKKISVELCENLIYRLSPSQTKETKLGALIGIKNLIKETKITDPILDSCLVDIITDEDKNIREMVKRIIKEVKNPHIVELLELKINEVDDTIKKDIKELL